MELYHQYGQETEMSQRFSFAAYSSDKMPYKTLYFAAAYVVI